MINIIETMNLQQGGIYFLKDYKPTGDYKRHNYIVLTPSDKIPYVNQIICIGITSCRHGGEGVIPINVQMAIRHILIYPEYTYTTKLIWKNLYVMGLLILN